VVGSESAGARVNASLAVSNAGETAYAVTVNVSCPSLRLQFAAVAPEHRVRQTSVDTRVQKIISPCVRKINVANIDSYIKAKGIETVAFRV